MPQEEQEKKSGEYNKPQVFNPYDVIKMPGNPPIYLMGFVREKKGGEHYIIALDISEYYGTSMTNNELQEKFPECDQWKFTITDDNRLGDAIKLDKKVFKFRRKK